MLRSSKVQKNITKNNCDKTFYFKVLIASFIKNVNYIPKFVFLHNNQIKIRKS